MLIIQAASVQRNLVLWAEDSDSRNKLPDRQKTGEHPHYARGWLLTETIDLELGDSSFASAIAWLPSQYPLPGSLRGRMSTAAQS